MTDRPAPDDDDLRSAEYALGLLDPAAARDVESRMQTDPALRARVILWTEEIAALSADLPPQPPPADLQATLDARLFPEESDSLFRRLGILPALVGALIAALLVVWTTNSGLLTPAPEPVLLSAPDGAPVADALADPSTGSLALTLRAAPDPGQTLYLWLILPDAAPLPLGPVTGPATRLTLSPQAASAAIRPGAILALSAEPSGTPPDAGPTRPLLAQGPLGPP